MICIAIAVGTILVSVGLSVAGAAWITAKALDEAADLVDRLRRSY